jgi:hypothetical protein
MSIQARATTVRRARHAKGFAAYKNRAERRSLGGPARQSPAKYVLDVIF